jgi:hypothetical protein
MNQRGVHTGFRSNFSSMKLYLALFLLPLLASCASEQFTVSLARTGAVSGIREQYSLDQDGIGTKTIGLTTDSESAHSNYHIDPSFTLRVRTLITDSIGSLKRVASQDTGEMTTSLQINTKNIHKEITWANVDPPEKASPAVDSLYHIMLHIEAEMIATK